MSSFLDKGWFVAVLVIATVCVGIGFALWGYKQAMKQEAEDAAAEKLQSFQLIEDGKYIHVYRSDKYHITCFEGARGMFCVFMQER